MASLLWAVAAWMGFSVLIAALPAAVESTCRGLSPAVRRGAWFFLALRAGPRVVVVPGVRSPCLVGLFRPQLVLPEESRFTDAELGWMVRHELEHHKAGDLWLTAVVRGLHLVLWFLPGMWWIAQRFLSAVEEACDHRVLVPCGDRDRRSYAQTLFQFLQTAPPRSVMAMASPVGRLKHRFRRRPGVLPEGGFGRRVVPAGVPPGGPSVGLGGPPARRRAGGGVGGLDRPLDRAPPPPRASEERGSRRPRAVPEDPLG